MFLFSFIAACTRLLDAVLNYTTSQNSYSNHMMCSLHIHGNDLQVWRSQSPQVDGRLTRWQMHTWGCYSAKPGQLFRDRTSYTGFQMKSITNLNWSYFPPVVWIWADWLMETNSWWRSSSTRCSRRWGQSSNNGKLCEIRLFCKLYPLVWAKLQKKRTKSCSVSLWDHQTTSHYVKRVIVLPPEAWRYDCHISVSAQLHTLAWCLCLFPDRVETAEQTF